MPPQLAIPVLGMPGFYTNRVLGKTLPGLFGQKPHEGFDRDWIFTVRRPSIRPTPVIHRPRRTPLIPSRPMEEERIQSIGERGREGVPFHKKFLKGLVKGIVPGIASGIGSFIGGKIGARGTIDRSLTARPSAFSEQEKELARGFKFGSGGGGVREVLGAGIGSCPPGMRPDFITGVCEAAAGQEVGEAIMGRYGAALFPGSMMIDRAVCLRGMQLADDGLCYNKSQISNKQRMWPAGRKPLLSGGDMRAIGTAARAGKRLEGATKRLQRMGMMKKPASGRRVPRGRGLTIKEAGAGSVTVQ